MLESVFSPDDQAFLKKQGFHEEEISHQLAIFLNPDPFIHPDRPCTLNDGIIRLSYEDQKKYADRQELESAKGRFSKFVPASGAATRMFKLLFDSSAFIDKYRNNQIDPLTPSSSSQDLQLFDVFKNFKKFPFYEDLNILLSARGYNLEGLLEDRNLHSIIECILADDGLNYSALPKGLLSFHRYSEATRTAFEEHLIQGTRMLTDGKAPVRIHFTVSPQHLGEFKKLLKSVSERYSSSEFETFEVDFSVQNPASDTIAVDENNRPARTPDGQLIFRPAGHGALIENLSEFEGDLVYIQNIDNIPHQHMWELSIKWKKILGGYLASLQAESFELLSQLKDSSAEASWIRKALYYLKNNFHYTPPNWFEALDYDKKVVVLSKRLDRPMRVCAMVRNEGEPGGGPFWVQDPDGELTPQIVEGAQIDPSSPDDMALLKSSTHFNPVDMVCAVRNWKGEPYNLLSYADPDAIIITRKPVQGRDVRALELPGLWNGAMARWNTVFVEVPAMTFTPVKTINDLLRPSHQPL